MVSLRPATLRDSRFILDLRRSERGASLNPTSPLLEEQEKYMEKYITRFKRNEEVYYICRDLISDQDAGVTRITGLSDPQRFGWEGLIVSDKASPGIIIDLIFTIYKIGFVILGKSVCGPWGVLKSLRRVNELHETMSIAKKVSEDADFNYYEVTKTDFLNRKSYFENRGFGQIKNLKENVDGNF
jgi:hypothetical protein